MTRSDEILAGVVLSRPDAAQSVSLGSHYFVALPRIGEDISVSVPDQDQTLILTVKGLLHGGDRADVPPPEDIGIPSITLFCEKL